MRSFINMFDKEQMYEYYITIVDQVKDYDKVTRLKMNDEILAHFLDHKDEIPDVFTLNELKEAVHISKVCKTSGTYKRTVDFYLSFPSFKHTFLFESRTVNGDQETFRMLPEFSSFLSNFVIGLELEERKYFELIVRGMLLVHGGILVEDILSLYFKKRPSKYAGLPVFNFDDFHYFKVSLQVLEYDVYTDALFDPSLDAENLDFRLDLTQSDYNLDFYHDFAVVGLPKQFLKKDHRPLFVPRVQELIHSGLQFSNSPENLIFDQEFLDLLSFVGVDVSVLDAWPIWRYGGLSFAQHQLITKDQLIDGSLTQPFLDYVHDLVRYGNKKYKYIPKNEEIFDTDAFEIIKKSLLRKDFLKQFHASRKNIVSELTDGFDNAVIMNTAIAYKYESGKLLIHHEGVVYHVSGISCPINENIIEKKLPCIVSAVLIPLADSITYALSIIEYRIFIGPGMISAFESELKESVHVHNIDEFYALKPVYLNDKHYN